MTHTTCTHPDAEAVEVVACGEQQRWYCDTIGGCYGEFTITKTHHVRLFVLHAEGCERKRKAYPAEWCDCDSHKAMGCVDCDQDFPLGTVSGPGVDVYA